MTATIECGVHQVTNEEHHALRALSNSGMKHLAVSPLRYWYHEINPAPKEDEEETAAQRLGSSLHCAVLEPPEVFDSRYACDFDPNDFPVVLETVDDICDWIKSRGEKPATKNAEGKATKKADHVAHALDIMKRIGVEVPILEVEKRRFFAQNEGKTILHPDEWGRLAGMARALIEEPALTPILAKGKPEQTLVAKDPETGVLLKARLDWMGPRTTLDLKTYSVKRNASIDKTIHDALYYEGHHRQIAFYDYVRRLVTGEKLGDFDSVIAYVESDQPHEVRLKRLLPKRGGSPNLFWLFAFKEVQALIRLYAECLNKYGEQPWREDRPIEVLADEDIPQIAY